MIGSFGRCMVECEWLGNMVSLLVGNLDVGGMAQFELHGNMVSSLFGNIDVKDMAEHAWHGNMVSTLVGTLEIKLAKTWQIVCGIKTWLVHKLELLSMTRAW